MPDLVFHFHGVNLRSSLSTNPLAGVCALRSVRGYPSPLLILGVAFAHFLSTSISLYFTGMNGAFMDELANEGSIFCD